MIVWGGTGGDKKGYKYNPIEDSWDYCSDLNAPESRFNHSACWTGKEMIIWGGRGNAGEYLNVGSKYCPLLDMMQKILVDAAKDPKLLEALLRNPATYARGGKSRTSTYLARYLTSRGIGNIVDVTDDRKMRDARQANQAGQTSKVAELILQFANPYGEVRQRMRQIDPVLLK